MFGATATVTQPNPTREPQDRSVYHRPTDAPDTADSRHDGLEPLSDAVSPDIETVFDLLKSERARRIISTTEEPMTAAAVAEACGIPRSTAYRNLRAMAEAGLLRKQTAGDAARYAVDFEAIVVRNRNGELELEFEIPTRSASEQLSSLWGEVRAGTGE